MAGYPYGNPQYPPPQNQIYPQLFNAVNAPVPTPMQPGQAGQPGFPYQVQPGQGNQSGFPYQMPAGQQMQQGFAYQGQAQGYQYQPGQPSAMSYPNVTPMAPSAPPGPGFSYPTYSTIAPTAVVQEPTIEWVPTTPGNAHVLSDRAMVAGYEGHDGSPLWVIRARFEGDLIPGKLAIKHKTAYVAWGGRENAVQNIEVCCARPEKVKWVEARNGIIVPPNGIIAGNTKEGEPLYIGRAKQQGSLTPGKVHPSHKAMYISFAGKEIPHKSHYEVLCTL